MPTPTNKKRYHRKQPEDLRQLGWVTIAEATNLSRLSIRTIYRWRNDALDDARAKLTPRIEVKQFGKRWYISLRSLRKEFPGLVDLQSQTAPKVNS